MASLVPRQTSFPGRRPTPRDDFAAFVETLRGIIAETGEQPNGIALSIAGVVDPDTQRLICANIPCIHERTLGADLEAELGLPVLIANDADCFAMAEAGLGAGRGHRIVFGAILGTGVGGGLVADGRLVNEAGGFAGEWGHGPIIASAAGDPPVAIPAYACGCGQKGCVDTVGGARGWSACTRRCTISTLPARRSSLSGAMESRRRHGRSTSMSISSPRR